MVLEVVGYIGVGLGVVGWICRKMLSRTFGTHDENDEEDVNGKVVLVTGGNSGLGKETVFEMVRRGAKVIMASRNLELSESVKHELEKKLSEGAGEMIPMKVDLGSLESVRNFAKEVRERFDKIDVLVNNAGVFAPLEKKMKTDDGFEYNFGVNHLGTFLLTNLILDLVKNAAPSRIVIVSSKIAENSKLDFDDLMLEKTTGKSSLGYGNSKYANLLFAKELAFRLKGSNVNVYAVSPGWVKTDLVRYTDMSWVKYLMVVPVAFLFMRTPQQGAQTILHCALSRKLRNETGQFYRNCGHWTPKADLTEELGHKLWITSDALVNKKSI